VLLLIGFYMRKITIISALVVLVSCGVWFLTAGGRVKRGEDLLGDSHGASERPAAIALLPDGAVPKEMSSNRGGNAAERAIDGRSVAKFDTSERGSRPAATSGMQAGHADQRDGARAEKSSIPNVPQSTPASLLRGNSASSSAVQSVLNDYARHFDNYNISVETRVQVAEIMNERMMKTPNIRSGDPANAPTTAEILAEANKARQEFQQKLTEAVGPDVATALIKVRLNLPAQKVIVEGFVQRTYAAGVPISMETGDQLADVLTKSYLNLTPQPKGAPTPVTAEQLSRYEAQDQSALRSPEISSLGLTPVQLELLKETMAARFMLK
jgi:hypothetical protein